LKSLLIFFKVNLGYVTMTSQ